MSDEMVRFIRNNIGAYRTLHLAHRDPGAQCGMAAAMHVGAIAMTAVLANIPLLVQAFGGGPPTTTIDTDDIRSDS